MQTTFNFFFFLSQIPKIIVFLAFVYVAIKVFLAFIGECINTEEGSFFKNVYNFFDPHHQSIFCYKPWWIYIPLIIGLTVLFCKIYIPPEMLSSEKGMYSAPSIIDNTITYFISYLIHENLGHNMFCTFGDNWFCAFSGDFMQILVPSIIYLFSLQLRGGLFFSPIILYWLSSAIYDAGIYASDALASQLALTSSDMITDHAAGGAVKGDWYYILGPFDALNYGETIGTILEVIACFVFALAIYSLFEYFRRLIMDDWPMRKV